MAECLQSHRTGLQQSCTLQTASSHVLTTCIARSYVHTKGAGATSVLAHGTRRKFSKSQDKVVAAPRKVAAKLDPEQAATARAMNAVRDALVTSEARHEAWVLGPVQVAALIHFNAGILTGRASRFRFPLLVVDANLGVIELGGTEAQAAAIAFGVAELMDARTRKLYKRMRPIGACSGANVRRFWRAAILAVHRSSDWTSERRLQWSIVLDLIHSRRTYLSLFVRTLELADDANDFDSVFTAREKLAHAERISLHDLEASVSARVLALWRLIAKHRHESSIREAEAARTAGPGEAKQAAKGRRGSLQALLTLRKGNSPTKAPAGVGRGTSASTVGTDGKPIKSNRGAKSKKSYKGIDKHGTMKRLFANDTLFQLSPPEWHWGQEEKESVIQRLSSVINDDDPHTGTMEAEPEPGGGGSSSTEARGLADVLADAPEGFVVAMVNVQVEALLIALDLTSNAMPSAVGGAPTTTPCIQLHVRDAAARLRMGLPGAANQVHFAGDVSIHTAEVGSTQMICALELTGPAGRQQADELLGGPLPLIYSYKEGQTAAGRTRAPRRASLQEFYADAADSTAEGGAQMEGEATVAGGKADATGAALPGVLLHLVEVSEPSEAEDGSLLPAGPAQPSRLACRLRRCNVYLSQAFCTGPLCAFLEPFAEPLRRLPNFAKLNAEFASQLKKFAALVERPWMQQPALFAKLFDDVSKLLREFGQAKRLYISLAEGGRVVIGPPASDPECSAVSLELPPAELTSTRATCNPEKIDETSVLADPSSLSLALHGQVNVHKLADGISPQPCFEPATPRLGPPISQLPNSPPADSQIESQPASQAHVPVPLAVVNESTLAVAITRERAQSRAQMAYMAQERAGLRAEVGELKNLIRQLEQHVSTVTSERASPPRTSLFPSLSSWFRSSFRSRLVLGCCPPARAGDEDGALGPAAESNGQQDRATLLASNI